MPLRIYSMYSSNHFEEPNAFGRAVTRGAPHFSDLIWHTVLSCLALVAVLKLPPFLFRILYTASHFLSDFATSLHFTSIEMAYVHDLFQRAIATTVGSEFVKLYTRSEMHTLIR